MSVFATFNKGGVHPADKKNLSGSSPIQVVPLSKTLVVAMSQHLGAPATLLKQKGEHVERGELIGKASSFISADVHSPVSGTVVDVRKTTLATSVVCDAAVIECDEVQPEIRYSERNWRSMTSEEIVAKIKEKGVVGLGGATFPAHVKLAVNGRPVYALVINGVECEPYLTADHRLMLEKPEEFLKGILICAKALNPQNIIVGIEKNKMDAVALLKKIISEKNYPIKVQPLKMKYPQGDEKQLLKATIQREIPSGKLPLDVGAVVVNAGTAFAIYNAVALDMPLTHRIVSITGECINKPSNVLAPIGTPVKDLIEFAGGFKEEPDKIISGGPMMGFSFFDLDTPITKGTSGVLCIKDEKNHKQSPCLSCGKCVAACPIGLQPTRLYALITHGLYEKAMAENLMDCKECGCCSYSCPAHLDLVHAMKTGKKMGRKK